MSKILIIGAGRSAVSLIEYLLKQASEQNWTITVADMDLSLAQKRIKAFSNGKAIGFDISDVAKRRTLISEHDFVISMLPAFMHLEVAKDCLELKKHLATASYVSEGMKAMDAEAKKKGLFFLNECGLDPGIDHASAMKVIDHLKEKGARIHTFKSYCGGLVAPESNDNLWGYKFSWNPRNVVLAGQGTAQYLENEKLKFIPYNRLFTQTENLKVEGYGTFDAYANRDSISYIDIYGLKGIKNMLRGTMRNEGYCKGWNVFVKLGLTDDSLHIHHVKGIRYADWIGSFIPNYHGDLSSELKNFMGQDYDAQIEKMMNELEIFGDKKIEIEHGSAAQILQALLEEKWKLKENDKDMIVMQHVFGYTLNGKEGVIESSLGVIGKDQDHTAMALTVGLPLAICVKNFLTGKIKATGVQIPVTKEIYLPLLEELSLNGIVFSEIEK